MDKWLLNSETIYDRIYFLIVWNLLFYWKSKYFFFTDPDFKEAIVNVTASVGREAILACVVQNLGGYKVS